MAPAPIGVGRLSLGLPFQLPPFVLFPRSGVHGTVAERRLAPEQIDPVDVESLLAGPTPAAGCS
jgi:hypothetical protein